MSKVFRVKPRDYQDEALDALEYWYWKKDINRLAGIMATGMGKTSGIAVNIPERFPELAEVNPATGEGGVLFIVHRIEIIRQAYEKFVKMYPDKWIGLEQGTNHCTGYEDFIFASVDSIGRLMSDRIFKYEQRKFGIIITDEAHHLSEDNTWDNVLTYFGVGSDPQKHFTLSDGRKPMHLMLTATPESSMAPFVDKCPTETGFAFNYDILYGIRQGWLVDIRAYKAGPKGKSLADFEDEEQVDYLMKVYRDYAAGDRTLVFARNVAQSILLADSLNASGWAHAMHVSAEQTILPPHIEKLLRATDDPRKIGLEHYSRGEIDVLTNRLVFTEGWDAPGIMNIVDNAPTKSNTLYPQKIGRGLRTAPDARIDDYNTAEERKAAIARSSKDALTYITTFDPDAENSLTVVGALWGGRDVDAEGFKIVEEVIDVIEKEEEEHPERPKRDIDAISSLEVELNKVDVWSQTIENDELKAVTPLRWVIDVDDNMNLYLPRNPRAKNSYEDTAVIWRYQKVDGGYRFYEIIVGGWVEKLKRPVKAQIRPGAITEDLPTAIKKLDKYLDGAAPALHAELRRGVSSPATNSQKQYMKNHSIGFGESVTEETANILIDNFRIERKLEKIALH